MGRTLYRFSDLELRACKWWARLPVPVGDIIPRNCPICRAPAVPHLGTDGRMAPCWPYACEADYRSDDPGRLRAWAPGMGCVLVNGCQVLGWVREHCTRHSALGPVADALRDTHLVAPYASPAGLPLSVALPRWRAAERPAVCPGCRARRLGTGEDCTFACGARYEWSSASRGLESAAECPHPAMDHVLRVARAKGPRSVRAAVERALLAFRRSVTVIDVFGPR